MTVFGDRSRSQWLTPIAPKGEFRFFSLGRSGEGWLLVVAYTEREGRNRLISAREATLKERRRYESE